MLDHKFFSLLLLIVFLTCSCSKEFDGHNGLKKEFYSIGNGTALKQTTEYKNGLKDGVFKEFYINSIVKQEAHYKNGYLHGSRKHYFENGKLKAEESFINGKRDSIFKYYYKNGAVEVERMFSNGKLNGIYNKYYPNGQIEIQHLYANGELDGEIKEFYDNGQVKYIAYFEKGNPGIGLKEFKKDGTPINNHFSIISTEVNKLAFDSDYFYYFNISPKNKNNTYEVYEGTLKNNRFFDRNSYYENLPYEAGKGYKRRYVVYSGNYKMEELKLIAKTYTEMGNVMIVTKTIRVSLNNYF